MPETLAKNSSFENIILTILAIVIILVIVGCVYTFIRAIFLFVFSSSKEENKKKGWNSIRFMIIGIILTIVLLFTFPFLFKIMSVPGYDKYTPQNIFGRAGELVNGAFKMGDVIKQSQKENEYRGNLYYDTTPDGTVDTTSPGTTDTSTDYSL